MHRPWRFRLMFTCASLLLFTGLSAAGEGDTGSWKQAYLELQAIARNQPVHADQARLVSEAYARERRAAKTADVTALPTNDLHDWFKAAAVAGFYAPADDHLADMRRVVAELERRKEASGDEMHTYYAALFQSRKFDAMAAYHLAHPTLEPPIAYRGEAIADPRHAVLEVPASRGFVVGKTVDLAKGVRILVIAHPLCHFTRGAIADIESRPALERIFAAHSVWVSPADRDIDMSPFQAWNEAHARTPIALAYAAAGWPEVRIWQTPTFFFLRDGKVVGEVVGWPKEGNVESLERELSGLGLLPPE